MAVRFKTQIARLGLKDYNQYLRSKHWKATLKALKDSGLYDYCLACGENKVEIHHRNYSRLGKEKWKDLIPLCRKCHQGYHDCLENNRKVKLANCQKVFEIQFGIESKEASKRLQRYISNSRPVLFQAKNELKRPLKERKIVGAIDISTKKCKVKITTAGQPCRKCGTPVEIRRHKKKPKPLRAYYFEWWFTCPYCNSIYMAEEAKRYFN